MDLILDVYRIDRAALDADLLGTPEHLEIRQTQSKAVMDEFKAWLDAERERHLPRGPMGEAIGHALGNLKALTLFLTDPHLPIDDNASERALRVAALGRKNFLFVGKDGVGQNLAGLYSLVATCEVNGINPVAYLADILLRVQSHPTSRIDELHALALAVWRQYDELRGAGGGGPPAQERLDTLEYAVRQIWDRLQEWTRSGQLEKDQLRLQQALEE